MAKTGNSPQHRARLGLAGLVVVVMLVLAATTMLRPQPQDGPQSMTEEPLAMLGLAPASSRQGAAVIH